MFSFAVVSWTYALEAKYGHGHFEYVLGTNGGISYSR